MTTEGVGPLLREWRQRRSMSQMALAHEAHVSPRHLSFVENGRSRPSAELVVALAIRLDVPLRERNRLLIAAGFAPRHDETPLDAAAMRRVRFTVQRLLDAHDPYPGMVLDRHHDIVAVNRSAERFLATLPKTLRAAPVNLFRACLHPDGFGRDSPNFEHWAPIMLGQLRRLASADDDPDLIELRDEIEAWHDTSTLGLAPGPSEVESRGELLVSSRFVINGVELSLFSTLTSFGSPRDITLDDLSIELFFPADDRTDAALHDSFG